MQTPTEQQLVCLLQLAQRERRRKQSKRNRRLIESSPNRLERTVEHRSMARRKRRDIRQRKQAVISPSRHRRALRNYGDERHGQLCFGRMATTITERADLLDPRRFDVRRRSRDATRCVEQ